MNLKSIIFVSSSLSLLFALPLRAGIELPVETIKEMAEVNPVNGRCSFESVEITNRDGVKLLRMSLKVEERAIPATIALKESESQWSESKGTDSDGSTYWFFMLKNGDGSAPGSITDIRWNVRGVNLQTESLSLQFIDPVSGLASAVTCM